MKESEKLDLNEMELSAIFMSINNGVIHEIDIEVLQQRRGRSRTSYILQNHS